MMSQGLIEAARERPTVCIVVFVAYPTIPSSN